MSEEANSSAYLRRDIAAIILFFVIILTVWTGLSGASSGDKVSVPPTDGVYDLRDFDFQNRLQVVDDITTWESWPGHLYTPEDFAEGIPGEGVGMTFQDFKEVEYVTHRLTLLLPPGEIYGISMKTPVYSMRLYIGGEEIAAEGNPTTTRSGYVPTTQDRTYFFLPQTERVDVIIHTANFVHGKSGCRPPVITLGHTGPVVAQEQRATFFNALLSGSLLTTGLYHLSLYLLNWRRTTTLLFSVCCILFALFDKKLILYFFPDISWYVEIRLEYLIHTLTFIALIWFFHQQFHGLLHKAVVYLFTGIGAINIAMLALDTRIFTGSQQFILYPTMVLIAYIMVRFAQMLKKRKAQYVLSFVGMAVLGLFAINDILDYRNLITLWGFSGSWWTVPVGMMFFVFCYSLVIAIEYAETQRRKEALAERNAMLDSLNRTKTEFLQDMSHEMKTPLTVIGTGADYAYREITREGGDLEEAMDALDTVREENQRLGRMVSGMVDLANMNGNIGNRQQLDFTALLQTSAETFRLALRRQNNLLRMAIPDSLPHVFVEKDPFTQVLANLLINAAEHTRDGEITIRATYDSAFITVEVTDTGEGIDPELLPRVLERGVSGRGGTGFGLFICKTVVEAHGGRFQINSAPGQGTTVTFTVPVYGGQEAGHRNEREANLVGGGQ